MSLTTTDEVRYAGNFSKKITEETLAFYLNFVGFLLQQMIGKAIYDKAAASLLSPAEDNTKLKLAEALLTVSYSLPAVGIAIAETGMLRTQAVGGRGGELETVSFAREIEELAAHFARLAFAMIPEQYLSDNAKQVWFSVAQRVFPGLDEMPTMATIHSTAEALIQDERGDEQYNPNEG